MQDGIWALVDALQLCSPLGEPDAWLDARDLAAFDGPWVEASAAVEDVSDPWIDAVRGSSFKAVYDVSENGEVAAEVSDDFGLICRYVEQGLESPWVAGLAATYARGQLPAGYVDAEARTIGTILEDLCRR